MVHSLSAPLPSIGTGLAHYLAEIRKFPILTQEEETAFARRWRDMGDRGAAYRLVTSHLRLVAKIAMRYRGYGLPIADIVSEGNIGLMQAVRRFDPERGDSSSHLCHVVDQSDNPGICPAVVVASKNFGKLPTEKAFLQIEAIQERHICLGRRRSKARAG